MTTAEIRALAEAVIAEDLSHRTPGGTRYTTEALGLISSVRAPLLARALLERLPVVEAAVEWRAMDLAHEKHDAYGPLFHRMRSLTDAVDALRAGGES